jgi:hypothetical protein
LKTAKSTRISMAMIDNAFTDESVVHDKEVNDEK